jgi:transcriptional regulator with XRE-family HTH domain
MRSNPNSRGGQLALDPTELRRAMARRGLLARDLALLAGLAPATVSGALHGRPVTAPTVARLAKALAATEPVPLDVLDHLLVVASGAPGATG